ncbi:MAG: methyltransferase [Ginsengibacter sp.]
MANNYFQFKLFKVEQSGSAMKVCTDSCIFGAWLAQHFYARGSNEVLLDVGTGTGLLSLMVAQKTEFKIHAIEIDLSSSEQSLSNFEKSPWNGKLFCDHADLKFYNPIQKFDVIICNPPFYKDHLSSSDDLKAKAMHEGGISLKDFLEHFIRLSKEDGKIALLLPYSRIDEVKQLLLDHQLFVNDELLIRQTDKHHFFRYCFIASRQKRLINHSEMSIKLNNEYSNEFVSLLKDYYLHL